MYCDAYNVAIARLLSSKQLATYHHLSHAQSDVHLVVILAFAPFMVHRCSYPHEYCSVYSQTNVYVQRPNYLKL